MSDIAYIIFMVLSFVFGLAIGWIAGIDGWVAKKGKIKKAKDFEDLV